MKKEQRINEIGEIQMKNIISLVAGLGIFINFTVICLFSLTGDNLTMPMVGLGCSLVIGVISELC